MINSTTNLVVQLATGPGLWEISLGVSNLILAGVVAYTSYKNANKDRAVHVADKQQDWLVEFRHKIAELMALQIAMSTKKYMLRSDGLPDIDEYEQRRLGQLLKLDHLTNSVLFMFDTKDGRYDDVKINVEICNSLLGNVSGATMQRMAKQHTILRELIDQIINRQRRKISKLDTDTPLI